MRIQAIRLSMMGAVDITLAILFGIYGSGILHQSNAVLAIFIVWIIYNLYELALPRSS